MSVRSNVRLVDDLQSTVPALATLSGSLRAELECRVSRIAIPAGSALFEEGESCGAFVAIISGNGRISKVTPDGRELLLYHARPGSLCVLTISCLLGNTCYPARGVALTDIDGIAVPQRLFDRLLGEVPPFRRVIFDAVGQRFIRLIGLVEEIAFQKLDRRLAGLLLRAPAGQRRGLGLVLTRTHQQLADDLGVSREVVSRVLGSFESQGFVALGRGRITLTDPDALAKLSTWEQGIG